MYIHSVLNTGMQLVLQEYKVEVRYSLAQVS